MATKTAPPTNAPPRQQTTDTSTTTRTFCTQLSKSQRTPPRPHARHEQWKTYFPAARTAAKEDLTILESPKLLPREVTTLADHLRQLKGVLYWGEPTNRHNTLEGKMMDGWIPSTIFLAMAANAMTHFDRDYFLKAVSAAQLRPFVPAGTNPKDVFCWPLVQIYHHREHGEDFWFARLHPQLRRADAVLQLDGTLYRSVADKTSWKR